MKYITGIIFCLLVVGVNYSFGQTAAQQKQQEAEIRDFKILSEKKDKYGSTIRKVEFYKGNLKVTQTIIIPPFPSFSDRIAVDPDTMNPDSVLILVDKTNYLVAVIYKRKRIRQYRAVFGPDRLKDKMMEGDRCTPEGWFKVVGKKEHSRWQKFILLNYPNDTSYARFRERKAEGLIPKNARIGNSVGIHGTFPSGARMVDLGIGWTDGCISLKPKDINDLYQFIWPGTRVYVRR